MWRPGWTFLGLCLVAGYSILTLCSVYPHQLSYFNEWAGGPAHGSRHLIHSSLDWGQDLLLLESHLREHPERRLIAFLGHPNLAPQLLGIELGTQPPTHITTHTPADEWVAGDYVIGETDYARLLSDDFPDRMTAAGWRMRTIDRVGFSLRILRFDQPSPSSSPAGS
jgi:hypothetical protein